MSHINAGNAHFYSSWIVGERIAEIERAAGMVGAKGELLSKQRKIPTSLHGLASPRVFERSQGIYRPTISDYAIAKSSGRPLYVTVASEPDQLVHQRPLSAYIPRPLAIEVTGSRDRVVDFGRVGTNAGPMGRTPSRTTSADSNRPQSASTTQTMRKQFNRSYGHASNYMEKIETPRQAIKARPVSARTSPYSVSTPLISPGASSNFRMQQAPRPPSVTSSASSSSLANSQILNNLKQPIYS
eukprot:CAMPEP_0184312844 /NCGR_PEP_ID=MMETSP1049-20130417/54906_1 /TAXON_ID=77928 /ORGANISM="Proteomonas sulcata, Strain CCMP704" /LENGTH=241 /DNA_ID=CAMNT_0026629405 /DNA_START=31 /DNA_END=756 /DNA_ORIENTATION=-